MARKTLLIACAATAMLAACSQGQNGSGQNGSGQGGSAPTPSGSSGAQQAAPGGQGAAGAGAPADLTMKSVNGANYPPQPVVPASPAPTSGNTTSGNTTSDASTPGAATAQSAPNPTLIKAEVLLDRANFSPGVIDGQMGDNVKKALIAYEAANGLPRSGTLDQAVWSSLTGADKAAPLKVYTITPADVAGPWYPDVGENFVKMSQQTAMGYHSPQEMLAERFHMDQNLLKALNPQADFAKAGVQIVVVDTDQEALAPVDHIVVDKAREDVTAYGADGKLVAVFPATVGSTERPSPKGTWKVKGVAQHPDYVYDPSKLTWGPKHAGKLHIPPGPNGPVGAVWIALTAPDYGIHGTPDPHLIGKTASHGCVRLTNWDAEELSKAVKPGVKVTFEHS